MKRRSVVRISGLIPRHGRPTIWGYGLADLAKLFGTTVPAVRKLIARGRFDPADLASVAAYSTKRAASKPREGT